MFLLSNKEIIQLTFDEYKKYLTAYPIFGELKVKITNVDDGYKIEVRDKDICEYTDSEGNRKVKDMSCNVVTMFTDKEGVINVIKHGFSIFTKVNKDLVIHTANFIGKQILDLEKHVSKER